MSLNLLVDIFVLRTNKREEKWTRDREIWREQEEERQITESFCKSLNQVVEIKEKKKKTNQIRTGKGCLCRLALARKSSTFTLLAKTPKKTPRQAEEWESFIVGKGEGFRCVLVASFWHRESVDRLARSGILCGWIGVHIWFPWVGSKLELGKELGKLLVIY